MRLAIGDRQPRSEQPKAKVTATTGSRCSSERMLAGSNKLAVGMFVSCNLYFSTFHELLAVRDPMHLVADIRPTDVTHGPQLCGPRMYDNHSTQPRPKSFFLIVLIVRGVPANRSSQHHLSQQRAVTTIPLPLLCCLYATDASALRSLVRHSAQLPFPIRVQPLHALLAVSLNDDTTAIIRDASPLSSSPHS